MDGYHAAAPSLVHCPACALPPLARLRHTGAQQRRSTHQTGTAGEPKGASAEDWHPQASAALTGACALLTLARPCRSQRRCPRKQGGHVACASLFQDASPAALADLEARPRPSQPKHTRVDRQLRTGELHIRVVRAALNSLLRYKPNLRTLDRALMEVERSARAAQVGQDELESVEEAAKNSIRSYFRLEDPKLVQHDATGMSMEVGIPVAQGGTDLVAGSTDRLDVEEEKGGKRRYTIVEYITGDVRHDESRWQQVALLAAMLLAKGYQWSSITGKLLYLDGEEAHTKELIADDIVAAMRSAFQQRVAAPKCAGAGRVPPVEPERCQTRPLQSEGSSRLTQAKQTQQQQLRERDLVEADGPMVGVTRVATQTSEEAEETMLEPATLAANLFADGRASRKKQKEQQQPSQEAEETMLEEATLAANEFRGKRAMKKQEEPFLAAALVSDVTDNDGSVGSGGVEDATVEEAEERMLEAATLAASVFSRKKRGTKKPQEPAKPAQSGAEAAGGVTVVKSVEDAERVLEILSRLREPGRVHAVDTEIEGWEPKKSMYGHGKVVCFSVYCGADVDFGTGPRLYVENVDSSGKLTNVLDCFRAYLEDDGIKKVFHNYAFDRAMFCNMGISVGGFAGDTIHMARLWRSDEPAYSLKALGLRYLDSAWRKSGDFKDLLARAKTQSFVEVLFNPAMRTEAIEYSTYDTASTWKLHEFLTTELKATPWHDPVADRRGSLLEFYEEYWRPYAEVLVQMEERGIFVDIEHLATQEKKAAADMEQARQTFLDWLEQTYRETWPKDKKLIESARKFNCESSMQMIALLFGKPFGKETQVGVSKVRVRSLGLPAKLCKERTKKGNISLSGDILLDLAGRRPEEGECGSGEPYIGREGCVALSCLLTKKSVQKSLSTFLTPLQEHADANHRVHSSFNINTVSGRLSSRNPNLQQQPALEKDGYRIRQAFRAPPGRKLIVADYAQLELRVMAHLAEEKSMIDALSSDGDIHSRTAHDMYPHIKEAVASGEVLLEGGDGSTPVVKDVYSSERRHAKTLNFGIIYGLQAYGLSKQLGCPKEEAEEIIKRWFKGRPSVQRWQELVVRRASHSTVPHVLSLRGRPRRLPAIRSRDWSAQSGAKRQAINSPAQGGAADIVTEAMIKVSRNKELTEELGYLIVLQVHDELVLEGPEEHVERALELVRQEMESPFLDGSKLLVPLPVDAHIVDCWSEAK